MVESTFTLQGALSLHAELGVAAHKFSYVSYICPLLVSHFLTLILKVSYICPLSVSRFLNCFLFLSPFCLPGQMPGAIRP